MTLIQIKSSISKMTNQIQKDKLVLTEIETRSKQAKSASPEVRDQLLEEITQICRL